jgi:hypothetical protein
VGEWARSRDLKWGSYYGMSLAEQDLREEELTGAQLTQGATKEGTIADWQASRKYTMSQPIQN